MAEWLRFDGVFPLHSHLRMAVFARGVSPAPLANHLFPRYTPFTHQLTEYKRRLIMLYCELFYVSHTLGDRTSSSVIGIVLR